MAAKIDHLVIAGGDLGALVEWWQTETGVAPTEGGAHPGGGTRNALVGLGDGAYVELIGPDPDQPDPAGPRPFGVDDLAPTASRLVTFAVSVENIDGALADVEAAGVSCTPSLAMRRQRPDGRELAWQLAFPIDPELGGVMPFLIDWGETPHPSADLEPLVTLDRLGLGHPNPAVMAAAFDALGIDLEVQAEGIARLEATLVSGSSTLRVSS